MNIQVVSSSSKGF